MIEFAVTGTVAGFNTLSDGRVILKIQPEKTPTNLERDERPGILDVALPASVKAAVAINAKVSVQGEATVYFRDKRDEKGKLRSYANFRYQAERVVPVEAA